MSECQAVFVRALPHGSSAPVVLSSAHVHPGVRKYVSLRYLTLVKESKKAFRENNDRPRRPLPCRRRWVIFRGWHPSPECHSVSTCRALEAHLGMEVVCRKHGTTHRRNDAKLRYWGECLRHRCYLNRVDSCVIP